MQNLARPRSNWRVLAIHRGSFLHRDARRGRLGRRPRCAGHYRAQYRDPRLLGSEAAASNARRRARFQSIRFITTDDFPPFNFLDANGHLTGFNVDLARAICAELAIRCTIQAREWDELVRPPRSTRRADAAIAGIAITAENREQLDFSDVYLRTPGALRRPPRRRDSSQPTPDGLNGKTLAVVQRTAHEAYLAAMFPEVGRKLYPTPMRRARR